MATSQKILTRLDASESGEPNQTTSPSHEFFPEEMERRNSQSKIKFERISAIDSRITCEFVGRAGEWTLLFSCTLSSIRETRYHGGMREWEWIKRAVLLSLSLSLWRNGVSDDQQLPPTITSNVSTLWDISMWDKRRLNGSLRLGRDRVTDQSYHYWLGEWYDG